MNNWLDPNLPPEIKSIAQEVLRELELDEAGLRVRYDSKSHLVTFTQDRRVVEMPVSLYKESRWSDIRFLFRAVLSSSPSAWNLSADDNDWSAHQHHSYHKS